MSYAISKVAGRRDYADQEEKEFEEFIFSHVFDDTRKRRALGLTPLESGHEERNIGAWRREVEAFDGDVFGV